jgi:hypothetical protein
VDADQRGLGQLQAQLPGRHPVAREHGGDLFGQVRRRQRPGAEVHPHAQETVVQPRASRHGHVEHPQVDVGDQPGLLGDGEEVQRRHRHLVPVPADQRLDADHPGASNVHDRLVDGAQPIGAHGQAQGRFDGDAIGGPGAQLRLVDPHHGVAFALRVVHGEVGVAEDVLDGVAVVRADDADADAALHPVDHQHGGHGLGDLVGQVRRRREVEEVRAEQHELVAAHPCGHVAVVGEGLEPLGHLDQHLVAALVAEGVVDLLEPVEVHEQQRRRPLTGPLVAKGVGQVDRQPSAVGQAGQVVAHREPDHLALGDLPIGDVVQHEHRADHLVVDAPDLLRVGQVRAAGAVIPRGQLDVLHPFPRQRLAQQAHRSVRVGPVRRIVGDGDAARLVAGDDADPDPGDHRLDERGVAVA